MALKLFELVEQFMTDTFFSNLTHFANFKEKKLYKFLEQLIIGTCLIKFTQFEKTGSISKIFIWLEKSEN